MRPSQKWKKRDPSLLTVKRAIAWLAPPATGTTTHDHEVFDMSDTPKRMQIKDWRPVVKNTLRGFATIELPIGLVIHDVTVHIKNASAWASMPAKVQLDREGAIRTVEGKTQYSKVLEWRSREIGDRFSEAVVSALDADYPGWRDGP